jgi:hypothetical protein
MSAAPERASYFGVFEPVKRQVGLFKAAVRYGATPQLWRGINYCTGSSQCRATNDEAAKRGPKAGNWKNGPNPKTIWTGKKQLASAL